MISSTADNWSIYVGQWRGVNVRLHVQLPLLALVVLVLARVELQVSLLAMLVLSLSVAIHELVRVITASHVGGQAESIIIGPVGGWSKLHLPVDPPAHLVTALVGPMVFFVLMVVAGCGLALAGYRNVPQLLLAPTSPPIDLLATTSTFHVVGQLIVWINWCLFLVSLLPVDPCAGAELLRGVLWPVVGRTTATSATSHFALGVAMLFALVALVLQQQDVTSGFVPSWFPFATASVFLFFGGGRNTQVKRYDLEAEIDEFDSDDEEWLAHEWEEEDREAVLVEHLQDKQQEALDRKRREREASEDARVDAILVRLRNTTFDELSEEDRAILKRASRRYRRRHGLSHED